MRKWAGPILIAAIALVLIIISYLFWDIPLAHYCRGLGTNVTDVAQIITVGGEAKWYFAVIIVLTVFFGFIRKNALWLRRSLFILVSLTASGLISSLIKWLAGRHRPVDLFNPGLSGFDFFGVGYEVTSFPSGHSVTAFVLATALTILFPRYGIAVFIAALAVAGTRVVLTSHYLSDTIAGAALGIIVAWAVKYYFDWKKLQLAKD
ncbi:MAG TPA: phosphatase PAP2 family protein [Smithellaceae bacterium]|nr:phosphatase PAP2 family protein [Smithellaceae bacterium]